MARQLSAAAAPMHRRASRAGLALILCAVSVTCAATTLRAQMAGLLVPPLERRFARPDLASLDGFTGMIVLGGGIERFREAGRLARRYPHLRIFASGAGDRETVLDMLGPGIDAKRVELENHSRTTYENALFTAAAIGPAMTGRWLLVTSATHMPRSVGAFRKKGIAAEPWPVYDLAGSGMTADIALHEWLGLVAYRVLGRSSALFPGRGTL